MTFIIIKIKKHLSDIKKHFLPAEIRNLKKLELLYIDNNKLEYIPNEIGNLLLLKKL